MRPARPKINKPPYTANLRKIQPKQGQNARALKKVPGRVKKSSKTLLTAEAGPPYTAAIETATPLAPPSNASVIERVSVTRRKSGRKRVFSRRSFLREAPLFENQRKKEKRRRRGSCG
jgi:hypothetical protein